MLYYMDNDYSIKVYRWFATIFHICINFDRNVFYIFPIMLALYLMLSVTHCAENYVGIIGGSLLVIVVNFS